MNNSLPFQFIEILSERLIFEFERPSGKVSSYSFDCEILLAVKEIAHGASDIERFHDLYCVRNLVMYIWQIDVLSATNIFNCHDFCKYGSESSINKAHPIRCAAIIRFNLDFNAKTAS